MNSPVETLTNRRLDWSWSMTKLKAIFQILFVQVFLLLVKETKFKIFIGFFRIERFPFSIVMEAPPHVHAEVPLKNYWVSLIEVFYDTTSIRLYF